MSDATDTKSPNLLRQGGTAWIKPLLGLALAVFFLRTLYLILDNPYELAGDEAQYWDWSRRLDWSYYSKGPGIAWLIGIATRLFGHDEWAIRLPAALSGSITILACGAMAAMLTKGSRKATWHAALMATLAPFLFATSQFMTIDAPFFAAWAVAGALTLHIFTARRATTTAWIALGLTIGTGVLLKYTMLLIVPGIILGLWRAHRLRPEWRPGWSGPIAATLLSLITMLPIVIWNQLNGWPTLAHLLGHLGAPGGDLEPAKAWAYNPLWTLEAVAVQILIIAPGISLLLWFALRRRNTDPAERAAISLLAWIAWPVFILYFLVSFATNIEANWPAAGWITLIPIAAAPLTPHLRRTGYNPWKFGWHAILTIGLIAGPLILFGPHLIRIPALKALPFHAALERGLNRVSGARKEAQLIASIEKDIAEQTGLKPFIAINHYGHAALIAYYHPDQPTVFSAASALGDRESSYDYFPDTSLTREDLIGRPAILVGTRPRKWVRGLIFKHIEVRSDDSDICIGYDYHGLVTDSHDH